MVEEALKELDQLEVSDNHPFAAFIYYLKGKCYLKKEQWRRAWNDGSLYNGIRLAEQSSERKNRQYRSRQLLLLNPFQYSQKSI